MPPTNPNKPEKLSRPESTANNAAPSEFASGYPEKLSDREAAPEISSIESSPDLSQSEKDHPSLAPQSTADESVSIHPIPKSITLRQIESILEDDLSEIYFRLDEAHQRLFKEEGERSARQIETILQTGKSIAVKVLAVIKKWLQVIPGINKFFIEQEAKIKTDQITRLHSGFPK
ncbi:hypothetical protein GYA13_05280 [Candidatus Kuenenbacteria bacterium]|nr:hypothetical protein [Candidatus Kuenenbacteria bacterium]